MAGLSPDRRARHDLVAASLAARDDEQLAALLRAAPRGAVGVGGGSSVIDVDGVRVFAKRIPLTDRELAHPRSTANLFDLPMSCQYGMHPLAGPGFGAWRELAANLSATEGVLAGECASFALLHHWRVLPGRPPVAPEHRDVEAVVAQFGGDPAVRARFEELAGARASLVLFLEHVPDRLGAWLADPLGRAESVERQLLDIVAFLRGRDLLHMDGHLGNMRADDERIHLVDFGLATSPQFELSEDERGFVADNIEHDADHAAMRLVNWLVTTVCRVPVPADAGPVARNAYVRRCASGDVPPDVPQPVAGILARHAPAAARMNDFCWRLVAGDVDARYASSVGDG
ncbi:serine/threonine protein phosphatase [Cellulomonas wangsupingiae]|uniref:Serine/threonine protein phosphatase n=1 Tax=Cellulomonas wangsupingiae TaxID=2968085 RepID=A0ABY5K8P5_9CELL|nr:serine/threonine protein phosphatase [Cellulomonas wangsupingiae]MCC2334997.1 serine/threonine protein phosphatase [Cellulomonas wangsupingiae]UUI65497.1 serine/threonine protein phosphatase [Cellulomonas wangsupingiae]